MFAGSRSFLRCSEKNVNTFFACASHPPNLRFVSCPTSKKSQHKAEIFFLVAGAGQRFPSASLRSLLRLSRKTNTDVLVFLRSPTPNLWFTSFTHQVLVLAPTKKKDPSKDESFFLVALVHSNWNNICKELARWQQLISAINRLQSSAYSY